MMDTSGYLALFERRPDALACDASLQSGHFPRYVTSAVIIEAHRRFLFDHGWQTAVGFLEDVYNGQTIIVRPDEEDERNARRLIQKYSDQDLTLCDALTFVVMFRLGIERAFTYDNNHFWTVGFVAIPPFYV